MMMTTSACLLIVFVGVGTLGVTATSYEAVVALVGPPHGRRRVAPLSLTGHHTNSP